MDCILYHHKVLAVVTYLGVYEISKGILHMAANINLLPIPAYPHEIFGVRGNSYIFNPSLL